MSKTVATFSFEEQPGFRIPRRCTCGRMFFVRRPTSPRKYCSQRCNVAAWSARKDAKPTPTLVDQLSPLIAAAVDREREKPGAGVVMLLDWLRRAVKAGEVDADAKVRQLLSLPLTADPGASHP